jgi:hypothetical protein
MLVNVVSARSCCCVAELLLVLMLCCCQAVLDLEQPAASCKSA